MNLIAFNKKHFVFDALRDVGTVPGPVEYSVDDFVTRWGLVIPITPGAAPFNRMLRACKTTEELTNNETLKLHLPGIQDFCPITLLMDKFGDVYSCHFDAVSEHPGKFCLNFTMMPRSARWVTMMSGSGSANAAFNLEAPQVETVKQLAARVEKATTQRLAKPVIVDVDDWVEKNQDMLCLPSLRVQFDVPSDKAKKSA